MTHALAGQKSSTCKQASVREIKTTSKVWSLLNLPLSRITLKKKERQRKGRHQWHATSTARRIWTDFTLEKSSEGTGE